MNGNNFKLYDGARHAEKDALNLMELLKKQAEDNKPIFYVGRKEKKVILTYDNYQKANLKSTCWDIVVNKNVDIALLKSSDTVEEYNARMLDLNPTITTSIYFLTEEEFNLLKEGLGE